MIIARPKLDLIPEGADGKVRLQLRNNNPTIPFPNCVGTFSGQRVVVVSKQDLDNGRYQFAFNCQEIVRDYFRRFQS
ncbi:hypothetical protein J4444_02500 [Candidatus Woesearchaeota archaeon]|nr:hypothetical protein [Candidatus Woesearchaeota archaeon]